MSSATRTARGFEVNGDWTSAGIAGVIAGVAFGLLIQHALGAMKAVGALVGVPGVVTGWIVHLALSIGFGLLFAGIVDFDPLERYAHRWTTGAVLGLVFGGLLWVVNLAFVWPIWLNAVGFPPGKTLPVPYLAVKPLVGHLVYGVILGAVYAFIR